MKLKTKIVAGMLCMFMLSVIIGAVSFVTIQRVQTMSWELDVLNALDESVSKVMEDIHIWRYELVSAIVFEEPFTNSLAVEHSAYGVWRASPNATWIQDSEIERLKGLLDVSNAQMHEATLELIAAQQGGLINIALLTRDLQDRVLPYANASIAHLQALSAHYDSIVEEMSEAVRAYQSTAVTTTLLIILASFVMFFVINHFVSRAIIKPISQIARAASEVAAGKLNVNLSYNVNDEIGALSRDVLSLVGVVRDIVDDLSKVHHEYLEIGSIHYKIDERKYQNSFKDVVVHVNHLLNSITTDIQEIGSVVEKVNAGDFNVSMDKNVWIGEWDFIPNTVNSLINNLNSVSSEIGEMVDAAAVKGNLSFNIDETRYAGDWREIMSGLNNIASAVNKPISEIRVSMSALNSGRFDTFVSGNYTGDFLAIKNDVNQMIKDMSAYIREIGDCLTEVSNGNLTRHINMNFDGDFNKIKESISHIVNTLHKTMKEISAASEQVLSGSKQISISAGDLANGAQEQASSVQELNASIDMINEQTQKNADNATEASELSQRSTSNAQEGNEAMQQMLDAMSQIKDSSNDISKIIKVIQDIAFQTNLLALNAAVEAARAGEHGRGFSVVAEEVRTLAGRSQEAATETTGLIQDSITRVESGSGIAESTAVSLDTIVKNAGEVMEIINNISTSSKEQAEAISQVGIGLSQISRVVQSNSAVSEETAAAAEELNSQAEMLRELVGYFKL
ncbi:MAG: methyl-accepting chemotaxis protein [Defluviitaleaceae bacterium]|nr:methyl-accepting chemotaxis protein [Defluviitaleaceae bacterium]MCL2262583.1 methyl-accepting chemotaxis protein [Defluviitaleaceae bacterium]